MAKILVIDDETDLRHEIVELLTFEDYEAIGAEDGWVGVERALQDQPDLILCDLTMPGLDGYGVLIELRANPATAEIPFIFITARSAPEDIQKGMTLGANDYLTKPFYHQDLFRAIEACLSPKPR